MTTAPRIVETDVKVKNTFLPIDKSRTMSTERGLLCPECGELLQRADVEVFTKCPFCNHVFEMDPELEDFIIAPMVEEWSRNQSEIPTAFEDELLP